MALELIGVILLLSEYSKFPPSHILTHTSLTVDSGSEMKEELMEVVTGARRRSDTMTSTDTLTSDGPGTLCGTPSESNLPELRLPNQLTSQESTSGDAVGQDYLNHAQPGGSGAATSTLVGEAARQDNWYPSSYLPEKVGIRVKFS